MNLLLVAIAIAALSGLPALLFGRLGIGGLIFRGVRHGGGGAIHHSDWPLEPALLGLDEIFQHRSRIGEGGFEACQR